MKYKLYNDNCLTVLSNIASNFFDLVVTDPPYGVSRGKTNIGFKGKRADIIQNFGEWDTFPTEEDFTQFTLEWLKAVHRVLKPHKVLCFFFSLKKLSLAERLISEAGYRLIDYFFKVCSNPCPSFRKASFWSGVEPILMCQKLEEGVKPTTPPYRRDIVGMPNYVRCSVVSGKQRTKHPTQKPLAAVEPLIRYWSKENEVVLDPFMGSNSTGVVAKALNRSYVGIEVNRAYYEMGEERIDTLNLLHREDRRGEIIYG